ncbi:alpha/beta-hydrolase [Myriangium duriaei CBS 260.36]|uniref:Alpha/beta-hydrolase n=1 Tax=Myriangium duriaei CBS 260.36 TaxID=1168546 RepID=A0A9P4IUG6_9PEZI|nr:alpha/beta-hydrolase [Myriangium duriaei CBS 260.36]
MAPGILYVTMQPKAELPSEQFEDWYNNEHGPLRLRLSFCTNGYRYRATDLEDSEKGAHEWMAVYDMDDLEALNGEEYMKLRGPPVQTQRETDLRPYLDIDRRSFDFISERKADDYRGPPSSVVVSVKFSLEPGQDPEELTRWYDEEHFGMLQKVPGWRRSRRFKTSAVDGRSTIEYLALHEYASDNGLGGPAFQAAITTPWAKKIYDQVISSRQRRTYAHYYTFGPAPRHISTVSNWSSPSTLTRSFAPTQATPYSAIESYVTTHDGAKLQYRLEGSPSASAPVILCVNSILTHWDIYSPFTASFLSRNPKYRVLRFLSRGRTSSFGSTTPISLSTLSSDLLTLLDALQIVSPALAIGVSLGGATILHSALEHPDRFPVFISADTNQVSPSSNPKQWADRIALSESDESGLATSDHERVVGENLAEATVRRWFAPTSYNDATLAGRIADVKEMVRTNSLAGFKASVKALYEYDMSEAMKGCKAKGMFMVGGEDGVLPGKMKEMSRALGDGKGGVGVECVVIDGAGHLPMVEREEDVVKAVEEMLASSSAKAVA